MDICYACNLPTANQPVEVDGCEEHVCTSCLAFAGTAESYTFTDFTTL